MKKILSFVLIICLVVAIIPLGTFEFSAIAATYSGTCGDNLIWNFNDSTGKLTITGTGNMDDNPSGWQSYLSEIVSVDISEGVTSIGDAAFCGCTGLASIVIPNSVTEIGVYAFISCSGLTSIDLPDHLTSIEFSAFQNCSGLVSITIPEGITSINNSTFCDCTGLVSIDLPDTLEFIGKSAFFGCTKLAGIVLPDNLTSIDASAFFRCFSLTSIDIPYGVTSIGVGAFMYCARLAELTVEEGNMVYHSSNNCIINTETKTLILGCKNSIIPIDGSVTSIYANAFFGCTGLTSIVIPNSVTEIGDTAFMCCSALTSVEILDNLTSIGTDAFFDCNKLILRINKNNTYAINYAQKNRVYYRIGPYTVKFKNENAEELSSNQYYTGDTVVLPKEPAKASDGTFRYEFAGWDSEVVTCNGDKVYTAVYNPVPKCTDSNPCGECLKSITVSEQPTKANYVLGEALNTAGLKLKLTFCDGSSEDKTAEFEVSGFDSETAGDKIITVNYAGLSTTFIVKVTDPSQAPSYVLGDADGNGKISIVDALEIFKYLSGKEASPNDKASTEFLSADADKNGKIAIVDALAIFKHIAGKELLE